MEEERYIGGRSVDVRHGWVSGGKKVPGISGKRKSKARRVSSWDSHHVGKTTDVLRR